MIAAPAAAEAVRGLPPVRLHHKYRPLFVGRPSTRYFLLTGGRGAAKSWHTSVFLLNLTYERGHVILFTRYTLTSANLSIIPEFKEKIDLLGVGADFTVTAHEIVNNTSGSRILFRGIKTSSGNQTASLKSIHGVTTWVLDEAEELTDSTIFEKIDLSIRHKTLPNRVIIVLNPARTTHFIYEEFVKAPRADTTYIHTTWEDNRAHLSESFIAKAEATRANNPTRYAHVFGGAWSDELTGLLWTRAIIERARLKRGPASFERIVVGVDPAASSHEDSAETGIVVCAIDAQRKGYVLEDLSGRYTPAQWGGVAVEAARRWGASIVGESNNGGDMVRHVVKEIDAGVRFIDAKAKHGKTARAEPIFALYENDTIYHVGTHAVLERQMIEFNPEDETLESPDRVDALVWAFSSLFGKRGSFVVA